MTCNACGEKPKNTAKDFTKAVIEINNPETLVLLRKVVIPASMGTEEQVPAAIGKYHNVILHYEANKHTYLYSSDGIPTLLEMDIPQEVLDRVSELEEGLEQETTMREGMDEELQSNIDAVAQDLEDLKNSPDVVDIVPTYAALQAYDTSKLGDNDEVRVLADETHDGASAYYRWDKTNNQWVFIGITGPYYTKDEVDGLLSEKQGELTAGENIAINNDTISADVGAIFYVDAGEFPFLPLNTSTPISIYKDKELTTLATEAEVYEALYSDKVVKIATSDGSPEDTIRTYLVTACDDDFYDGRRIGFNIITNIWTSDDYYERVEFTWEPGMTRPSAVKRVNRCVRVEEVQGGTYTINNQFTSGSGIYELRNTGSADLLLLPKGIDGDPNFQLKIKPGHSVYIMEMVQTNAGGRKYLVFGATNGSDVEVALVEPNATAKLKLWAQYTNNLTTTNSDGQKVLSAYQGKVLADRIGNLSTLQTTAKTSTVDAINELVSGGGGPTVVQTTGQSTTDVMSQKAVTDALATAGGGLTTLSYGSSTWNDFITAYDAGKIVYCRASSNSDPASGAQTRMAFMAYINNPTSPTEVEFQYVRSVSTKTAAQQMDQVFVYKLTSASGGTWTVATRDMASEIVAGTNMTSSYSNGALTLNATQPTVNDSTVTVTNNGTSKGSFTTNQSAAGTIALDYPEITMTTTDPGEGATLAANHFIGVYE